MDYGTIISAATAVGVGAGGFIGGRLTGRSNVSQIASDTIGMLQAQVDVLKEDKDHRDLEILDLTQRVAVLEGLVTQRAAVDEVHEDVRANQAILRRIADKVEA